MTPKEIMSIPKSVQDNQNDNGRKVFQFSGVKNVIQIHFCFKLLFDCSTNVFMFPIQEVRVSFRY